jgi:predicted neutral ceramidase superfamily lipid hydrolase
MTNHMRECSYVKSSPIFTNQPTNYFQFQIKINGVKEHCTIHPLFPARSGEDNQKLRKKAYRIVLLNFSWCSQIWKWRINLPLVYLKYISMALHLFFCPGATAIPYCRLVPLTYTYSSHKHFRWWTFWGKKKKRMMDIFLSSIVLEGYTQNKLFFYLEVMLARYSLNLFLAHTILLVEIYEFHQIHVRPRMI